MGSLLCFQSSIVYGYGTTYSEAAINLYSIYNFQEKCLLLKHNDHYLLKKDSTHYKIIHNDEKNKIVSVCLGEVINPYNIV